MRQYRNRMMPCLITGAIALFLCHNGMAQSKKEENLLQQTSEVNNLMVQYQADRGSLTRFYTVPFSPERRERLIKFQQDYLLQLESVPFDQLSTGSKVDYILFKRNIDNQLRLLDAEAKGYEQVKKFFPFAPPVYELEKQRRRGLSPDSKKLAADMHTWQQEIRKKMLALKQEPELDMPQAEMASAVVRGLQQALKSVFDFYYGYDPKFSWWVEKPYRTTDSLLNIYAGQLKSKGKVTTTQKDDGSGIIGKPIGREELIRQLQFEMIPYTPEELIEMANKEFAWCDKEMLKASREMGFGDNWKKAMEKVKNSYVPEGKQPELILRLYNESIDFLKKNNLVTIPPIAEETWRMTMMSPQQQLISPFFLGGETILIAYPTNTMEEDDKLMSMRGNNPHFSRAVVHHELIAGHHLQRFMGNRFKAYREFDTPFWTEGWALYQEFILWDLKFPRSAEDRVGMLFWRMHRCARIIFSLNYHLGNWTPQQCIDFLVERVNHERANAAGEVRRSFTGGYGPLYQLAYMVGGQQFYALKKELVDTGKMSFREFHDAVLRENGMPVEMVRAILTKQQLKKDFVTGWKFYGK
ncbi:DUF885 family protein [Pseudoflavitalea rhizosphaerae]|uniref:DUF885 family protein n=1 Tax=Pseudoflavitalea rhizosphaerae TaxID=1884793 RepID=UPI001F499832|nr:DUF885 family protein [Pseudoflavitalea rhizosphaerae]